MNTLRDAALILLSLEACLGALAGLTLLVAVNYGLFRFRWWRTLPQWFHQAHGTLLRGRDMVERLCRLCTAPISGLEAARAGAKEMIREVIAGERQEGGES